MRGEAALFVALVGCAPARPARLDALAEPSAEELRVIEAGFRCPSIVTLVPGLPQACGARPAEGAALGAAAAVDLAAAISVTTTVARVEPDASGALVPWVALQDVWGYSLARHVMDGQMAAGRPFVPQERLGDLVVAPFQPRVLARPVVLAPTVALAAAGVALGAALGEPVAPRRGAPNVFGATPDPVAGWLLYGAGSGALFTHVAISEEAIFRGVVQSGLTRRVGPTGGWALGTLVFGGTHAINALLLPADERLPNLTVAVPYITVVGGVIGAAYTAERYSLSAPVAMHFWYDVLVSTASAVASPDDTLFSIGTGGAW